MMLLLKICWIEAQKCIPFGKSGKSGNKNVSLRHSMNRIQSKNHKIGTYAIKKISLSCFDDDIYILNDGYDGSALAYQS